MYFLGLLKVDYYYCFCFLRLLLFESPSHHDAGGYSRAALMNISALNAASMISRVAFINISTVKCGN